MKKTLLTLVSVLFCAITFAQSVPQGINYQAVARDASGAVLMNQALTIQFSVISDITTGNVSWQETHQDTTNAYGLFTAIIGGGTSTTVGSSAAFDVIDWGASNHLLKVEIDFFDGNGWIDMGTTAFMSVPYALQAGNPGADSTMVANMIAAGTMIPYEPWNQNILSNTHLQSPSGAGQYNGAVYFIQFRAPMTGIYTKATMLSSTNPITTSYIGTIGMAIYSNSTPPAGSLVSPAGGGGGHLTHGIPQIPLTSGNISINGEPNTFYQNTLAPSFTLTADTLYWFAFAIETTNSFFSPVQATFAVHNNYDLNTNSVFVVSDKYNSSSSSPFTTITSSDLIPGAGQNGAINASVWFRLSN